MIAQSRILSRDLILSIIKQTVQALKSAIPRKTRLNQPPKDINSSALDVMNHRNLKTDTIKIV
jgi:hypothetical protein